MQLPCNFVPRTALAPAAVGLPRNYAATNRPRVHQPEKHKRHMESTSSPGASVVRGCILCCLDGSVPDVEFPEARALCFASIHKALNLGYVCPVPLPGLPLMQAKLATAAARQLSQREAMQVVVSSAMCEYPSVPSFPAPFVEA